MRRFFHRLLNVFRDERSDAEAAREIAAHLALLEDEYLRRGMTADEARLAARRALGSAAHAHDLHRDARTFAWLDDARRDVAHGLRSLRLTPGFTAIAVVTLALGIGANTAIFSVISAVLLRPLPYRDAERLVQVFTPPPNVPGSASFPRSARSFRQVHFDALRDHTRTLEFVAGYILTSATLTGRGDPVRLSGLQTTATLFPLLGVPPLLGRAFAAREESAGADDVVVLSYDTWRRYFNSDPAVIGRVAAFDGRGRIVVGVMPEGFSFPDAFAQYWVPHVPPGPNARLSFALATIARLRDGVSRQAAEDEVNRLGHQGPDPLPGRFDVLGIQDDLLEPVKPALLMLAGAVGLVLLIACVNVANLLLARTAARQHEIAVRRAVGASPGRLFRQMLTESTLLSMIGAVAGTALAVGAIDLLRTLATSLPRRDLGPGVSLPRLDEIGIDVPVLLFTIAAALVTGIVCGLFPAIRHVRAGENRLRERVASPRVRGALVVAEIAMAIILLVGGGLLIRSFIKLTTQDLGYDADRVLTFQATPAQPSGPAQRAFAEQLVERIEQLPGVSAAGYANNLPLVQQSFGRDISAQPYDRRPPRPPYPGLHAVSPGMIRALGLRIVEGRGFSSGEAGRREALVTRSFARSGFFDGPAIGSRIYSGRSYVWEVVGILDDFRQFSLDRRGGSEFYIVDFVPAPPGLGGTYFAVRGDGDPVALVSSLRSIVRDLDPAATLDNVATMDQIVSNAMSRPRLYAVLLGIFAAVAMILAAIGIYGVLSYVVAHRAREIGIRMALGAQSVQVLAVVLRQTTMLTVIGVVVGLAGAAALSRSLEGLLYGLTPLDATTFLAVVVVFGVVATVASYMPARRATRVDPLVALRTE